MSLRTRYWMLVAAWFLVPPLVVLCAFVVSSVAWALLAVLVIGSQLYIARAFRCGGCGTRLRLVRPARLWPLRHPGFSFPRHCHQCGRDLSGEGERREPR